MTRYSWILAIIFVVAYQLALSTSVSSINTYLISSIFWLAFLFFIGLFDFLITDIQKSLSLSTSYNKRVNLYSLAIWIIAVFTLQGYGIGYIKLNLPIITLIAFFPIFIALGVSASSIAVIPVILILFSVICFYARIKFYEQLIITTFFWIGATAGLGILQTYRRYNNYDS